MDWKNGPEDGIIDDKAIFDRSGNDAVDHWRWIDLIGMGDAGEKAKGKSTAKQVEEGEVAMEG